MDKTIAGAVAKFDTRDLQHARRTIEAELRAAFAAGVSGTQVHAGQIELLTAIGAELDRRNALASAPPHFDTCWVDGQRLSFQIRVF